MNNQEVFAVKSLIISSSTGDIPINPHDWSTSIAPPIFLFSPDICLTGVVLIHDIPSGSGIEGSGCDQTEKSLHPLD
jgi:hypothetical protein